MLERIFGGQAQTRILEFLLENKGTFFNLSEIAEKVGVSPSTVCRVVDRLLEEGIVVEIGRWKQMRIIKLNEENQKAALLLKFVEELKKLKT